MRNSFICEVTFAALLIISKPAFAAPAPDLYQSKCTMCHGADGRGDTPAGKAVKVHDFHSPAIVKMSNAELIAITSAGKGKMPGYGGKLSGSEIESLVAHIRILQKK